ncbi:MAG: hypothetical protein LBV80_09805 [Deltaproteobacteria bacterium]|jgi:ribosome maturation factor RimP|nr:hypothetical protein [Deltaproteobacteria bacterium]
MNKLSLPDQISLLVEPLLASLGLCLWGLEYFPSTSRAILRIYIEKAGFAEKDGDSLEKADNASESVGSEELDPESHDEEAPGLVGIDECTEASRLIGLTLEVEDLIPSAYVLEVSTPGLDRRFFQAVQLAAYVGEQVEINLHEAAPGHGLRRKFVGRLVAAQQQEATNAAPPVANAENYRYTLEFSDSGSPDPADSPASRVEFAWADVKKAKLLYEPPQKVKPGHKPGTKQSAKKSK